MIWFIVAAVVIHSLSELLTVGSAYYLRWAVNEVPDLFDLPPGTYTLPAPKIREVPTVAQYYEPVNLTDKELAEWKRLHPVTKD
jgi:hypothetical protein